MSKFKPMNAKYKKPWIKALESGNYRQTQNWLADTNNKKREYCCLGVLCEVAEVPRGTDLSYDGDGQNLTNKLKKEFGITNKTHDELTRLNDEEGASFKEIAKFIKENL